MFNVAIIYDVVSHTPTTSTKLSKALKSSGFLVKSGRPRAQAKDISSRIGSATVLLLPLGESLAAMQQNGTSPWFIVVSGHANIHLFERLSNQMEGGWAFLLKSSNGLANLHQALAAVRSGFVMIDPQLKRLSINDNDETTITDQEISVMWLKARPMR